MNNFFLKKRNKENGFVILIAVLVSGLLLTIGAFIATVAVKEIILSNSSSNSQKAFYAADAASECVAHQDMVLRQFATSSNDVRFPATITCNNDVFLVSADLIAPNRAISTVEISFVPHTQNRPDPGIFPPDFPYALVTIEKMNIGSTDPANPDSTIIRSRGFNIKERSKNRVERAIRINY